MVRASEGRARSKTTRKNSLTCRLNFAVLSRKKAFVERDWSRERLSRDSVACGCSQDWWRRLFEAIVPASAAAAATCEQLQATESLDKCFFSRISDDMLGSFFACFWTLLVLQSHGVLLPGATFFEAVLPASAAAAAATSSASSRRQQNLSTISRQCAVFLGFQTTR